MNRLGTALPLAAMNAVKSGRIGFLDAHKLCDLKGSTFRKCAEEQGQPCL